MGFSEAVGWWNVWQLRMLVLGSLFLQYFLCVAAFLRKGRIPAWFRFLTWLAYLGGDAIAIYALATLYNRHQKQEWVPTDHNSVSLEALWAPILLLHLGGQDGITAYNIEDNELWKRHVLTALSQVTVAVYVFCKSWPQEKRLMQAGILIFIPGIVKCMEKPWALKNASINSLVDRTTPSADKGDDMASLEEYVRASSNAVNNQGHGRSNTAPEPPYSLFVDIPPPYSYRLSILNHLLCRRTRAHGLLQSGLFKTFNRFYSKEQVRPKLLSIVGCICSDKRCFGYLARTVIVVLAFASIGLFHKSHRETYNAIDVKVTYILLCCTAILEYITNALQFTDWSPFLTRKWPDQISQCNLMGYLLARNRRWSSFPMVFKDYLDELCCTNMKPFKSSHYITAMVLNHIIDNGWNKYIKDVPTYHTFNDSRGQMTLQEKIKCGGGSKLEESLQRPFDESVVLWHLATNFCFYRTSKSAGYKEEDEPPICMVISNYMAYLLFVNPEMLMAGSRRSLFRVAYGEVKDIANEGPSSLDGNGKTGAGPRMLLGDENLARKIIQKTGLVHEAWVLADELMGIGREEHETGQYNMWAVIQGVWVEMLCFSASRCRGFLHAKSLGNGGEYLNYVWLLLSYMGMETLAERLQRTVLHARGDMGASHPAPSGPLVLPTGDNNA